VQKKCYWLPAGPVAESGWHGNLALSGVAVLQNAEFIAFSR
jgi:hypothetical protein